MTSPHNEHPSLTSIRFFKIILRTRLADGILKLPRNFTRKYGDEMSNPLFLKPPDGSEWKIHLTKHDGEIWFQKGWKEFAMYYSLDHGHLLFFEYKRTSHFDVLIFDNSAVEIDYPYPSPPDVKDNPVLIGDDDSVETLDQQFSSKNTRVKTTVTSPPLFKKMKNSITTNFERSLSGVNLHQYEQTRSTCYQGANLMKQKLEEDEGEDNFQYKCPKVEPLTSTALNEATTFSSEHPSFMLVMKPSFIKGDYLEIPPQFSDKYLKRTHAVILLEILDGRRWPVICSAPRITGGWHNFVSENNLNVGNVCVFEMIHKIQGLAFKVSIFRDAQELSSPISQGGRPSQRFSQSESHFKSQILTSRDLIEATKFTSENAFFMVILTDEKENIVRRPVVPINFVREYLVNMSHQNVMMMQFRKKLWPVKLSFTENNRGTITRCSFSAGWHLFSRKNKLQPGDVCIFELINKEDAIFNLHVFRDHSKFPSTNWTSETSSERSSQLESLCKPKILTSRAREVASKFTSKNPFFMITLTLNLQANIPRCPRVPANFVTEYFVNMKQNVLMMQFRNSSWPVKLVLNEHDKSGTLSAGWSSFARENELEPGDVCIFELVNGENATFDVHVFCGHNENL
ncbi:hypothetical protein VNO78_09612 [Psophocarpus tetragonolobus]|uniref:TF-B3 domain-containing protein n=1 Tax=Psophocarpus tetragonolobus TaxID=3891 RepID=A0AAN9SWE2_PSOTE